MAKRRKKYDDFKGKHNFDKRDGLKPHRINEGRHASRNRSLMSMWDEDNIVLDSPTGKGYIHVSINKQLRKANSCRCRKMNGYNGKLNGRH